jgi:hypothetical protein
LHRWACLRGHLLALHLGVHLASALTHLLTLAHHGLNLGHHLHDSFTLSGRSDIWNTGHARTDRKSPIGVWLNGKMRAATGLLGEVRLIHVNFLGESM